jgi:hypothetical protein
VTLFALEVLEANMQSRDEVDLTYHAVGEFVVVFQWVEHLYRQIGWRILDPEQREWPPMALRRENNHDLINKVTELFSELTRCFEFPNGAEKAREMESLRASFHELRRYRNRILHSTFVELKAGEDLHGYVRAGLQVGVDSESGELIYDHEPFTARSVHDKLVEYGRHMVQLNFLHVQLIHWMPFDRHGRH